MRTHSLSEVRVTPFISIKRALFLVASMVSGLALAQPANDLCANAEVLTAGATGVPVLSSVSQVLAATTASDAPFSCNTSSNRSVWYTVTPSTTGWFLVDTCPTAAATGTTVTNTIIAVYSGGCGAPVELTGSCNDTAACGSRASNFVRLQGGTQYWVQVAVGGSTAPSSTAQDVQLALTAVADPDPATDECSASSPTVPLNRTVVVRTANDAGIAPNTNSAQLPGDAGCFVGTGNTNTNAPGRDVPMQFRAPAAGRYSFRVGAASLAVNSVLYLSNTCLPASSGPALYEGAQCLAAANRTTSSTTASEQISCHTMAANENVFVWVDESAQSVFGAELQLTVTPCTEELEPNDTPATANALSCAVTGRVNPTTDADFYALGVRPAGSRVFALVDGAASANGDFDLRVNTATTTLEYDDGAAAPSFGGISAAIAGTLLPQVPTWLQVDYFGTGSSTAFAEPYVLYSKVETGPATLEVEPNDTVGTATTATTTYFEGSITDGGTDVDFFAFSGNAGDLVFAALDALPTRPDAGTTGPNFRVSVVDSTGVELFADDDTSTSANHAAGTTLTSTSPTAPGDAFVYRLRTSGTFAIRVGKTTGTTETPYLLSVSVGCSDVAPTITALTPSAGTPAGGDSVTITGTGFSDRSVVRFGATFAEVSSFTGTQLVVRSPASATGGDVDVTVTNGIGLSATSATRFTYEDPPGVPPTVVSINPTSGRSSGGTVVTVTGTIFRADAGVFFDVGGTALPATSVTRNSTTQLVATSPAHAEGVASVQVVNTDGLSATLAAAFTYLGPPTITGITPNAGFTSGGQTLTITGSNFRTGTTVRVGANLATGVTPAGDGLSLTAVTATSAVNGAVDVVVTTADGQTVTSTGGYTYNFSPPTLTAISPTRGFAAGNTLITITGANFLASPTVTVGGTAATSVTRVSATSVTARTPAGTGVAPVVLTNSDGQATTAAVNFTYDEAPTVASVTPTNGPVQGGTRITIDGANFVAGARVTIGGVPAFAVAVSSGTSLTATTNSGSTGTHDVVVTNPDTQSGTLSPGFTLDGAPSLVSLSPISGGTAGGTVVTITGAGFRTGATVSFGSTPATAVTVVSDTELTATTAARAIGVVSVSVRNPDNQAAVLERAFRYVEAPSLTSVAPTSGGIAGGDVVRVTGVGFTQSTRVTFDGVEATSVSFISTTELDAVTPAHAPGAVDVTVDVEGATATLAGGFEFVRGPPSVGTVAPNSGPIEGGTLVTITGSGFLEGATVSFGGTDATGVVVASSQVLRAVAPAHAVGAVNVLVTNSDGQTAALSDGFTYVTSSTGPDNSITDGGSGAVGTEPNPMPTPGGVSCGCTSFDGSMFGFAGLGLVALLSRRRRRS